MFTDSNGYVPIEDSYVRLQRDILDNEEGMQDIFKPYFQNYHYYLITGTNLAKLIRDFCYKEQQ